jgi:type IV secretion system protein VirB2
MKSPITISNRRLLMTALLLLSICLVPDLVLAQASPFQTGATALQANILAIATPVAIIVVMVLGVVAASGGISWGWPIAAMIGIAVMFGAPQIVGWTRGMFGV